VSDLFVCGGSGKLTEEGRAELDAYRVHLVEHRGEAMRPLKCRFCFERAAKLAALSPNPPKVTP
jgi:hypothetical protein